MGTTPYKSGTFKKLLTALAFLLVSENDLFAYRTHLQHY